MTPTIPHNSNGHRRRQIVQRVLAEETHCALCGGIVNKTLTNIPGGHSQRCTGTNPRTGQPCTGCVPHPKRAEVDEDIPRSRGGSPYDRENTHLMHRECNRWKSTRTLAEARKELTDGPPKAPKITTIIKW